MKLNLTPDEYRELVNANFDAAISHIESLMNNPQYLEKIPQGATIIHETSNDWVNQQNQKIAELLQATGTHIHTAVEQSQPQGILNKTGETLYQATHTQARKK